MYDDNRELSFTFKLFAGIIVIAIAASGFLYWGHLSTKKVVNQIENDARKSDPLVINTYQTRSLELLASIESYQRKLKSLNQAEQADVKVAIEALEGELTQMVGKLDPDQVPPLVKAHRNELKNK
jgi:hypothetical protein